MMLLCLAMLFFASKSGAADAAPELWALRYGTSTYPAKFVVEGGSGRVDFAWYFFVLKNRTGVTLIDTGFDDPKLVKRFGLSWVSPVSLLSELNITPAMVNRIIVTHGHFDHAGMLSSYPNAEIVIATPELKYLKLEGSATAFLATRKITTFSGTFDAGEGVTVEEIGGHAEGSSVVWIEHPRGRMLLAGDESYLAANWEKPVLLGTVYNKKKNLEFLSRVKALHERMGARLIVIPFHEPAVRPEGNGIQRLLPR
jgi:glyoxylase-like metal-dependent hydrolase (beta-lactamase superfamily II)